MTDHTPAAQAAKQETVLTDAMILHRWACYVSDPSAAYPLTDADKIAFARAIESALLSKLRAPVADERAAVAYLDLGAGGYMDVGSDLTDEQLAALPKGRHMLAIIGTHGVNGYTPAALASAPVAGETGELLRALVNLHAVARVDRDEDYAAVSNAAEVIAKHAAPRASAEPVGMVLDERRDTYRLAVVAPGMRPGDSVYAAPQASSVAGEAVAYRVGTDLFLPEALPAAERYAEIRQKPLEPLYAAPQASEAVRQPDYTLQHADHMAVSAERLMEAINARDALIMQREESDDVDDETMHDQHENVSEYLSGMRNAIYEYRKRRNRAALSAQPGAQKNGGGDA